MSNRVIASEFNSHRRQRGRCLSPSPIAYSFHLDGAVCRLLYLTQHWLGLLGSSEEIEHMLDNSGLHRAERRVVLEQVDYILEIVREAPSVVYLRFDSIDQDGEIEELVQDAVDLLFRDLRHLHVELLELLLLDPFLTGLHHCLLLSIKKMAQVVELHPVDNLARSPRLDYLAHGLEESERLQLELPSLVDFLQEVAEQVLGTKLARVLHDGRLQAADMLDFDAHSVLQCRSLSLH